MAATLTCIGTLLGFATVAALALGWTAVAPLAPFAAPMTSSIRIGGAATIMGKREEGADGSMYYGKGFASLSGLRDSRVGEGSTTVEILDEDEYREIGSFLTSGLAVRDIAM
ncbi:hypothetical protein LZ554_001507 [Drepanopeziza brunnea f. sp. 'monogermtubi']|nr:hypothetical protein LZ554_001507 [Drepanopeziza brunnea f. sp. 'monogermtubi']